MNEFDSDDAWMQEHAVIPRASDHVRDAAMRSSGAVLGRRRWIRRSAWAVTPIIIVAVALNVGLAREELPANVPVDSQQAGAADAQAIPPGAIVIDLEDPEALPLALANATPAQKAAILKAVGDSYLESNGGAAKALPYYRQYLSALPEKEQVAVQDTDTWLLAQLRQGKRMEVRYANASQ